MWIKSEKKRGPHKYFRHRGLTHFKQERKILPKRLLGNIYYKSKFATDISLKYMVDEYYTVT